MSFDGEAEAGPPGARLGPGTLALVVGASGAGKDTLIAYARGALRGEPGIVFPQRVVTRKANSDLEDHASVSVETFAAMLARRRFALHWTAHGLHYGVPAEIDDAISQGAVVVANVSRGIVGAARARYEDVLTVLVTASPAVLAERLALRGREPPADIEHRLARAEPDLGGDVVTIVNDGPVERAGDVLVAALLGRLRSR